MATRSLPTTSLASICELFILLLLLSSPSTCFRSPRLHGELDRRSRESFDRQRLLQAGSTPLNESVLGIEFTLDSIISSITLSNGTTVPVGIVDGDSDYKALMRSYLAICDDVQSGNINPFDLIVEDSHRHEKYYDQHREWTDTTQRIQNSWLYKFRTLILRQDIPIPLPPDRWVDDNELSTLVSNLQAFEEATFSALFQLMDGSPTIANAYIALPSFLFTSTPTPSPPNSYRADRSSYRHLYYDEEPSTWYTILTDKFPVAINRATGSSGHMNHRNRNQFHDYNHWISSPYPRQPIHNSLEIVLKTADIDTCTAHNRPENCSLELLPPVTALGIDFSNATLSLSAMRFGGSAFEHIPYSTYSSLGAWSLPSYPNSETFWNNVVERVELFLNTTATRSSRQDIKRMLLIGDGAVEFDQELLMAVARAAKVEGVMENVNLGSFVDNRIHPMFGGSAAVARVGFQERVRAKDEERGYYYSRCEDRWATRDCY